MTDALATIRARMKIIQDDIRGLNAELNELMVEAKELTIAEKVLMRLHPEVDGDDEEPERTPSGAPVKPAGIPTMPEMIVDALRSSTNPFGFSPKEIMEFIAAKYWPEVRSELVGPIAWRMAKEGRLVKNGAFYSLPQKNEAAGTPSQDAPTASETELFK